MRTDSPTYREIARQAQAHLLLDSLDPADPLARVLAAIDRIAPADPAFAARVQAVALRLAR